MQELKKQMSKLFKDYKNAWIDEYENAKKDPNGKFNPVSVMKKETDIFHQFDVAFIDAEERAKKSKKKGWL